MRKVFKQRELASVTPLYFFWNMEPVEVTLHKMIFSLYYGIWRDNTSPTCTISKKISDNKGLNGQYWIHIVAYLCRLYDLPPPIKMWELELPGKNHWKKFLHNTID